MNGGWQRTTIGEVCDIVNGGTPKTGVAAYWGGPHQWITPAEMGERSSPYVGETERTITDEGLQNSSARPLPPKSIILSSRAPIGHLVINTVPMATNQGCKGLISRGDVDHKFLYYYLSSVVDLLNDLGTGTTFKELSGGKLKEVPIALPPIVEQQRIVHILDEALAGIAAARANAEKNRQNARAVFAQQLNQFFAGDQDGWVKKSLSELCEIKHGFAFDGCEFSSDVPRGCPLVITPGNFTEDGRLVFDEKNSKRYRGKPPPAFHFGVGDLVVVMTDLSSKMKILGKPAFIDRPDVLHNQRIGRVVFLGGTVENRLVYYYMMSDGFLQRIRESATGTMVRHTAPRRILSNVMPFPSARREQVAMVAHLDSLREESQRLESISRRKLAALDELGKSLLHRAFAGGL